MSKIYPTSNSETLTKLLQMYQAVYDTESQEVTLTCICDGAGAFLEEMRGLLRRIGCVDIQSYSDVNEQYGTKEKPWCTCKFTAVGKLPVVPCKGEICIENRYEDSSLRRWINTLYKDATGICLGKALIENINPPDPESKKFDILSSHELKKERKKMNLKWEFYDYDVGMYRTTGYKCPVCNIEYGDNIYLYKGIPTFKQRKIPFSYCPNCGTKLKMEE